MNASKTSSRVNVSTGSRSTKNRKNAVHYWTAFLLASVAVMTQAQPPAPTPKPVLLPATAPSATLQAAPLFISIGDKPAIVFDAPSVKAAKTFILARQQPVEVLVKLDKWIKIRDADNTVGWVENSAVELKRRAQVSVAVADIRNMPNPASSLVFEAQRAVILDVTGAANDGWLPVRHRDGQQGFVRKSQVWGE